VQRVIEETARAAGITRRSVPREELVERPLYALINEGAKVLEEGVALRASDIDIIYIYGYGFPPYRGGPMWYADTVGLKRVYERVRQFEREHGAMWKPAGLLQRLAESGRTFADFDRERAGTA
jgi:3-hydroxyacyl-CoA dehydrogenase